MRFSNLLRKASGYTITFTGESRRYWIIQLHHKLHGRAGPELMATVPTNEKGQILNLQ